MAAGIAHEIRNPLGIINNALYDLGEILDGENPEVREDLRLLGVQQDIFSSERALVGIGATDAISIFVSSALLSPISILNSLRTCPTMSWLNLSPAMRTLRELTNPPNEMMPMSVVPPPMSTIICPRGSWIGLAERLRLSRQPRERSSGLAFRRACSRRPNVQYGGCGRWSDLQSTEGISDCPAPLSYSYAILRFNGSQRVCNCLRASLDLKSSGGN